MSMPNKAKAAVPSWQLTVSTKNSATNMIYLPSRHNRRPKFAIAHAKRSEREYSPSAPWAMMPTALAGATDTPARSQPHRFGSEDDGPRTQGSVN